MLIYLPKIAVLNITAALISLFVLVSTAPPRAFADQVTPQPGLKPAHVLKGQVRTPDGKAMANVTVVCFDYKTPGGVKLKGVTVQGGDQRLQTDAQGNFTLERNGANVGLMVANDKGFLLAQSRDLTNGSVLVLQPWGRIEGVRTDHNRPLPNHRLSVDMIGRCVDLMIQSAIDTDDKTTTDSEGRFVFEHVPPVEVWLQDVQVWLGANASREPTSDRLQEIDVQPGETRHVEIATHGRTVVGRIEMG